MSRILSLDSATHACSVALMDSERLSERVSESPREHTQRLLPMVDDVLNEQQISLEQVDAIAYSAGPGSFTGLRIGLSIAQGLAYGADIPLVPVSTLEAMALTAIDLLSPPEGSVIVPVIDARMDEIYWSAYHYLGSDQPKKLEACQQERVDSPENCSRQLQTMNANKVVGIGSGWHYDSLNAYYPQADLSFYPRARYIAQLAQNNLQAQTAVSPINAEPVYLRNEIHWKKRERIRTERT